LQLEQQIKRRNPTSYDRSVDKLEKLRGLKLKFYRDMEGVYTNAHIKVITYWTLGWILSGLVLISAVIYISLFK